MIFYLHYLAQAGIINIVKLAGLKTVLPLDVDKLANTLEAVAAEPTENRGGYLNSQDTNVW